MSAFSMARSGFAKILSISQEEVTIKAITFTRNEQDDISGTPTEYRVYAKLNRGGTKDIESDVGGLGDADLVMYFPDSVTSTQGLSVGNYIEYNSLNYKIKKVSPYNLADGLVYTKAYLDESNESL